jgi:hypothetical protein
VWRHGISEMESRELLAVTYTQHTFYQQVKGIFGGILFESDGSYHHHHRQHHRFHHYHRHQQHHHQRLPPSPSPSPSPSSSSSSLIITIIIIIILIIITTKIIIITTISRRCQVKEGRLPRECSVLLPGLDVQNQPKGPKYRPNRGSELVSRHADLRHLSLVS